MTAPSASRPAPALTALPLAGRSVLLLEDNLIVALEAESLLQDLGATMVWTAGSIAEARLFAAEQRIDCAMLDINIGDETSAMFADELLAAGTPYFFASGYGHDAGLGASQRHSVIVRKPYGIRDIRQAAAEVLERQATPALLEQRADD